MSRTDKNGNMPEVGGFLCDPWGGKARIVSYSAIVIFTSEWCSVSKETEAHVNVGAMELAKVLIEGYTFEPKPEEKPEREIPKEGTLVNVWSDGQKKSIRISAGVNNKGLGCYVDGRYEGIVAYWLNWEVIK